MECFYFNIPHVSCEAKDSESKIIPLYLHSGD